jgi:hypothetical protein
MLQQLVEMSWINFLLKILLINMQKLFRKHMDPMPLLY